MKKLICVLTLLLLASTAMANVTISCAQVGDTNEVIVSYVATEDANKPRGMGLEITADSGATIGNVTPLSPDPNGYWVFPGSIDVNDVNFPSGTPHANDITGGIIVEMGSLHYPAEVNSVNAPGDSGDLLSFTVSGDCNVSIAGNAARGNVVNYDAEAADAVYSGCTVTLIPVYTGCFPLDHPDWDEWHSVGEPNSWCYPKQCHGDADGADQEAGRGNYVSVGSDDVTVLLAGYNESGYSGSPDLDGTDPDSDPDTWIAADFDHSRQEAGRGNYVRVGSNDVTVLLQYYNEASATVEPNCLTVY
jgi:hypothetical protein